MQKSWLHRDPFLASLPATRRMTKRKILIVDDNAIVVKALSMKLTSQGFEVVTAEDGSGAVNLARTQKPDLILLDISFPPDVAHGGGVPWDGFLIMGWLQRMEETKKIPVIVITGGEPAKYKDRAMAAGAVSFFRKPVNPDELLAAIRQALGEAPAAASAGTSVA
jgi:CheY-like chemotaxis protein